jgi:transcriptional regulator with XRE-family HTH domain
MTNSSGNTDDLINPATLKHLRKLRGLSQQDLANRVNCKKDTISRWERGLHLDVRRREVRHELAKALRVEWPVLTKPIEPGLTEDKPKTLKVKVSRSLNNKLALLESRYHLAGLHRSDIIELAPLLFLIVAEGSLLKRSRKLDDFENAINEANEAMPHLALQSEELKEMLNAENWLIDENDIDGGLCEGRLDNPFFDHIRDLAEGIPESALSQLTYEPNTGEISYELDDKTLRRKTGLTDSAADKKKVEMFRAGSLDLDELEKRKERSGLLQSFPETGTREDNEKIYPEWLAQTIDDMVSEFEQTEEQATEPAPDETIEETAEEHV